MTDIRITIKGDKVIVEERDERDVNHRVYGGWKEVDIEFPEGTYLVTYMNCKKEFTEEKHSLAGALKRYLQLAREGLYYHNLRFCEDVKQ